MQKENDSKFMIVLYYWLCGRCNEFYAILMCSESLLPEVHITSLIFVQCYIFDIPTLSPFYFPPNVLATIEL